MKQDSRDLTLVGIKLIGLWVLFHALIGVVQHTITGTVMHQAYSNAESRDALQSSDGVAEETVEKLVAGRRVDSSMQAFSYQLQRNQAWSKLPWEVVMALVGLYMCRSGTLVLNFLAGKEKDPNM